MDKSGWLAGDSVDWLAGGLACPLAGAKGWAGGLQIVVKPIVTSYHALIVSGF